jgi:hypothetical protein
VRPDKVRTTVPRDQEACEDGGETVVEVGGEDGLAVTTDGGFDGSVSVSIRPEDFALADDGTGRAGRVRAVSPTSRPTATTPSTQSTSRYSGRSTVALPTPDADGPDTAATRGGLWVWTP